MGIVLTQSNTFIIGSIAKLLGFIMNGIFNALSYIGIENIGLSIIIFTVIVYTLMIPMTIKQQKFSRMSAVMNPEIQKIQKKYKNKKDQASMMKMQEETKLHTCLWLTRLWRQTVTRKSWKESEKQVRS